MGVARGATYRAVRVSCVAAPVNFRTGWVASAVRKLRKFNAANRQYRHNARFSELDPLVFDKVRSGNSRASPGEAKVTSRRYVGRQRSEVRGQRSEVRGQRSEVRGQRSEVRGQRSEVRGQRSEVRSKKTPHPSPLPQKGRGRNSPSPRPSPRGRGRKASPSRAALSRKGERAFGY